MFTLMAHVDHVPLTCSEHRGFVPGKATPLSNESKESKSYNKNNNTTCETKCSKRMEIMQNSYPHFFSVKQNKT